MAYRVTFRALLRPTHWHLSPSHQQQHRFIAPATTGAHLFSHCAAARSGAGPDQTSWDSIVDEADVFAKADNLPDTTNNDSSPSQRPRRTTTTTKRVYATQARQQILDDLPPRFAQPSHAATSPPNPKQKKKKKQKAEPAPELPPLEPLPSLDDLHPLHYNDLRLWVLRRTGHAPTTSALESNLATWLRGAHRAQTRQREIERRQLELRAAKREALDLAWEWDRQVAVKSGIERTERELRKDAIVLRRLERRRIEKLEQAQRDAEDKERKEREELDALIRAREAQKAAEAEEAAARLKRAPEWKKHQVALREQFPSGWAPPKRLSREAMDLVRTMHAANPSLYSTAALAAQFKVSPEAIRRILKSRFEISKHEADRREAKRKEARKAEAIGGQHGSSSVWGGNVAAEAREMETIRQTGGDAPRRQE